MDDVKMDEMLKKRRMEKKKHRNLWLAEMAVKLASVNSKGTGCKTIDDELRKLGWLRPNQT